MWYWRWCSSQDTPIRLPWLGTLPKEMDSTAWGPYLSMCAMLSNISPLLIITYHPYLSMYTVKHITLSIPTLGTHPPFLLYSQFILQLTLWESLRASKKCDLKIYPWLLLTSWFLRFPRPVYKFCSFPNLLPPWICYYSNICFNKLKLSTTTPFAFPAPKAFFGFRKIRKMIEIWEKDPDLDQEN